MHLDEAVERGQRGGALAALPLRVGLVELRLLRQQAAGRSPLDALEHLDRLVVAARSHLVARVCVQFFRAVLVVEGGRRTAARHCEGQCGDAMRQ
jgi:hypothetical protein